MGDPVSLGMAGLSAAGAGISALGQIQGGYSRAAEANYMAQVARNNAQIAEQNAQYSAQAGGMETLTEGLKQRYAAGQQVAELAASGLDVNTGSPARIRRSQAELGMLAEEQTAANAALRTYGYRTQETGFQAEAGLQKAAAKQDVAGGYLGAAGTLLSSTGNIGFKWAGLQNTPVSTPASGGPYGGYAAWSMGGAV